MRPENAGMAVFGVGWIAMTAAALPLLAQPSPGAAGLAAPCAALWALLFSGFEACVAVRAARGRSRQAKACAAVTAAICILAAWAIAAFLARAAAQDLPLGDMLYII